MKDKDVIEGIEAEELKAKKKERLMQLPQFRGVIPSRNAIRQLPNLKPGEIFWTELDDAPYVVVASEGNKIALRELDENATMSTGLTVFEMNQNVVAKEPLFDWNDEEKVRELDEKFQNWFFRETQDEFYCLYGRNIHYITLIKKTDNGGNILEVIKELLEEFSKIISFDFDCSADQKSVEIWIRTENTPAEILYFFPYDRGLVKV